MVLNLSTSGDKMDIIQYEENRNKELQEAFNTIFYYLIENDTHGCDVELLKDGLTIKMACSITNEKDIKLSKYIN